MGRAPGRTPLRLWVARVLIVTWTLVVATPAAAVCAAPELSVTRPEVQQGAVAVVRGRHFGTCADVQDGCAPERSVPYGHILIQMRTRDGGVVASTVAAAGPGNVFEVELRIPRDAPTQKVVVVASGWAANAGETQPVPVRITTAD